MILDQIDDDLGDMHFCKFLITHSYFYSKDDVNYFEVLFESIPDYRKIVLLLSLNKKDDNSIFECGFFKK